MKRIAFLLALSMLCLLTACGATDTGDAAGGAADSIVYLDAGDWPENEYTAGIPVPPGTVTTAYIDTQNELCAVTLSEVSEGDFHNYVAELEQNQFSRLAYVDEEIAGSDYLSTGTLYSDGTTSVSMSFLSEGTLGMCIVVE